MNKNKEISTIILVIVIVIATYLITSYIQKHNTISEIYSINEKTISLLLKNKKEIKINTKALWSLCVPNHDKIKSKGKYYLENVIGQRAYAIVHDNLRSLSFSSNSLEDLIKKSFKAGFILKVNVASKKYGICFKKITITPYNKAINITRSRSFGRAKSRAPVI